MRAVAVGGFVAQLAFIVLFIIWGFIENDYGVMRQDVSDFGALDATHPLPYNIILCLTGALTVVLAYGLYRALRPGALALASSVVFGVFGFGQFLDGLLREDCSPSGNEVCRRAAKAGDLSWHHTAHDLESIVTIAAVILAPFLLSFVFQRRANWRPLALYSLLTAIGTLAFVVPYAILFATHDGSPVNGLLERGAIIVALSWAAIVSVRLFQLANLRSDTMAS